MRLVSAAGGWGTDYQIIDRIRESADTTRDGVEFAMLSWHQSRCVDTVRSEAISLLPC